MRYTLFILFVCGLSHFGKTQNFAKVGTRWFYWHTESPNYWSWDNYDPTIQDAVYFESVKDTLIEGKTCQVVEQRYIDFGGLVAHPDNPDFYFKLTDILYFLNENNRVYFYKSGKFNLIYDFNLTEGDTICAADFKEYQACGPNIITDTIMGDFGNEKRIIYFSDISSDIQGYDVGYFLPVIDQVGGERFLYPLSVLMEAYDPYYLWCYYQDNTVYERGKGYCPNWNKFVVEAKEHIAKKAVTEIKLYPNPIEGVSKLVFPNLEEQIYILQIYNTLGEIVVQQETNNYYFELNQRNFAPGIYQYVLKNSLQEVVKSDKFLSF